MAENSFRQALAGIVQRLQHDFEAAEREHEAELESVRQRAEQHGTEKLEELRAEWSARLERDVTTAREDAERRLAGEMARLRSEAEQAAASADRVRQTVETSVAEERGRAADHLAAEAGRWQAERAALRQQIGELEGKAAVAEKLRATTPAPADVDRVAERQLQLAAIERLLNGVRTLDAARSLSQVLTGLLSTAAAEAPRVALFVRTGATVRSWKARGFDTDAVEVGEDEKDGLIAEVLRRGEPMATSPDGFKAPRFANLAADRAAIAVPLLVGAEAVAVLYADDAVVEMPMVPAPWPEAVEILCRHASASLAHLTAASAVEGMRRSFISPHGAGGAADTASSGSDDTTSARRYARLLVSEIKLYNEPAVRVGRQNRDLLARLAPEIDRARKLYEQRIAPSVAARSRLFQQELVQTLADGDATLLGGSA